MSINVDKLLAVLRARGCDPRDLRDGAHEAHHAIYVNLRKPWTRDRIHEALLKLARRSRIESIGLGFNELLVEWIVCERAGAEYDVEHWAHTMWMETMRNMNILLPTSARRRHARSVQGLDRGHDRALRRGSLRRIARWWLADIGRSWA